MLSEKSGRPMKRISSKPPWIVLPISGHPGWNPAAHLLAGVEARVFAGGEAPIARDGPGFSPVHLLSFMI